VAASPAELRVAARDMRCVCHPHTHTHTHTQLTEAGQYRRHAPAAECRTDVRLCCQPCSTDPVTQAHQHVSHLGCLLCLVLASCCQQSTEKGRVMLRCCRCGRLTAKQARMFS
jgi:hypothetical protein